MFGPLQAAYYGDFVDAFFLGILAYQVGQYTWDFPKDRWLIKCWVWLIFAIEVTTTVLQQRIGAHRFLENAQPEPKGLLFFWEDAVRFMLLGVVVFMTQGFLSYQVFVMTSRRVSIFLALLFLTFIVAALTIVCGWFLLTVTIETFHSMTTIFITLAALAVVLDFVIAGILCFVLWKSQIGNWYSDQLLRKVMVAVVETSSLTAFFALMDILFFTLMPPENQSHILWNTALAKVYAISVLAQLNGRRKLRPGSTRSATVASQGGLQSPKFSPYSSNHKESSQTRGPSSDSAGYFRRGSAPHVSKTYVGSNQANNSDIELGESTVNLVAPFNPTQLNPVAPWTSAPVTQTQPLAQ